MKSINALIVLLLLCSSTVQVAEAKIKRSAKAVASFKHQNPCPATGLRKGRCPGYVVDHVEPLCAGGLDAPINMQWQTVAEAKAKDKFERKLCR